MQRLRKNLPSAPFSLRRVAGGTVQERCTLTVVTETGAHRRAFRDAVVALNLECPRYLSRGGELTNRRADKRQKRALALLRNNSGRLTEPRVKALRRMAAEPGWPVPCSEAGRTVLSRKECKRRGLPPGTEVCFSASFTVWGERHTLEALSRLPFVLSCEFGSGAPPFRGAGAMPEKERLTGRPKRKPHTEPKLELLDRSLPPAHLMPYPCTATNDLPPAPPQVSRPEDAPVPATEGTHDAAWHRAVRNAERELAGRPPLK